MLIAHPEPIVRYGLRSLLQNEPDVRVIGEVEHEAEASRSVRQLRPDLALIGATPLASDAAQRTAVIVIAGENEIDAGLSAIRAGAAAYLLRDCQLDDIRRAIRVVAAGQTVFPRLAMRRVQENRFEHLSDREIGVLQLVSRGMSNKQAACELGITLSTVKSHVSAILAKLELSSRTQLALYATGAARASLDRPSGRWPGRVPWSRVV